jgi:hypothetical protein
MFGNITGHPAAFSLVIIYGVFWFISEPTTFDWHAISTLLVRTMTCSAVLRHQRVPEAKFLQILNRPRQIRRSPGRRLTGNKRLPPGLV